MKDLERKQWIFTQLGYKPHQAQQPIHDSTARFKIPCCGRRFGKTTIGAKELTASMVDPTEQGYYWIVGPNYTQGEKEFRIVYHDIVNKLRFGNKIKKQYNVLQGNMRIEMPWGTVLEVKSAERQESLLGEGLKGVIMSEAARHSRDTWEQYVRPALSDHRGWAIFPSTPRGYNWYQGLFMLGQMREMNPSYESWRLPSWENDVVYPLGRQDPDILEMEQNQSKQFFAQEIAADFTSYAGKIYDEFNIHDHVTHIEYDPMNSNFWVFDYGWANPFVCLDIMVDAEENVFVWREYQVSQKSTWDHGHVLMNRDNPPNFHVDGRFGDPRGGDSAATLALVVGDISSEDVDMDVGYEWVRRWLKLQPNGKPKLFIDESCVNLIRQMEQLHNIEAKEGVLQKEGQHKYDDHGPDALRYFFSQYFHLGFGSSLSDIYPAGKNRSEGATFFQQNHTMNRYSRF